MRFALDFNVITRNGKAAATVSGRLEFPFAPAVGDIVALPLVSQSVQQGFGSRGIASPQLSVKKRIVPAEGAAIEPMLMLDDVVVADEKEAISLMAYFEEAFDFDVDCYL